MPSTTQALAFLGVFAAVGISRASDWSRWRGPEGTGISLEKEWKPQALASPKVKWKTNVGAGHSSMSISAKRLYTMGNQGGNDIVYCFDAETGKEVWRHSYSCPPGNYPGTRATPVLDADGVYTLGRDGDAFCLDAATGKVKWQKNLLKDYGAVNISWGLAGSPLVFGNSVIYNARASGIALDKTTGAKLWESGGGQCGYASPVHFTQKGKECVAIAGCKEVTVVDAQTGERLASHPWVTQYDVNAADPVYFDGKLFVTSGYNHGCVLLDVSGKQAKALWEGKELCGHFASPVYLDGHLYGIDGNTGTGKLKCMDAKTGRVLWTAKKDGCENLVIVAGKIIAVDKEGELVVAEAIPTAYKEIARAPVLNNRTKNWTAPVLANGFIYCRNSDGELVCLDAR